MRERQAARGGLIWFVRDFWHILEPDKPLVDGWPLWAMCQHLEAVTRGEINRLLINVPPGSMKSLLLNVFWPAWEWTAAGKPGMRYISFSYASYLTERDNQRLLDLITDYRFKEVWTLDLVERGKTKITTDKKGWKFASSVRGVGTGERANRLLLDDPHNIKEGESETVRVETVRWFNEAMRNRLNDVVTDCIIIIMQRVHEDDVSGSVLAEKNPGFPYVHLCIPMEFDPDRRCTTRIGWADPRVEADECFWPERFPPEAVAECKAMGAFAWASQYQQTPEARSGGLLSRDYWRAWDSPSGKFPRVDLVVVSLDPAFTAKDENDPSGITVWGCFRTPRGDRGAILLNARREWLELHGPDIDRHAGETWDDFRARTGHQWGLVEHVADECKRWRADVLLIESKASGLSVAQEMARLYRDEDWRIELVDPAGLDKVARVIRVQGEFGGGLIYTPDRPWAKMLIDEAAVFPRGKYDDLVDSTSQALWWLKQNRFLQRRSEYIRDEVLSQSYKDEGPLYPI
jgi:predicted phage terminase large subunit-like protein